MMKFYRDSDFLSDKIDHQSGGSLFYAGNNTISGGVKDMEAKFALRPGGPESVQFRFIQRRKLEPESKKRFAYEK